MTPLRVEDRGNGVVARWLDRPEARNALEAERAGNARWSGSLAGLARRSA
jgi:hypothetical protein